MEKVIWKKGSFEVLCSCKLFETEGLICRHFFHIARIKNLKNISEYVHKRWRKNELALLNEFSQGEKDQIASEEKKRNQKEIEEEKRKLNNEPIKNEILEDREEGEEENEGDAREEKKDMEEEEEPKRSIGKSILPNFRK